MIIDITMPCDISTKSIGIIKSFLGIILENSGPGTEFPRVCCAGIIDHSFCAGIGPLKTPFYNNIPFTMI